MSFIATKDNLFKQTKEFLDEYIGQDTKCFIVYFDKQEISVLYHNRTWVNIKFEKFAELLNDKNIQKICDNAFEEDKDAITKAVRRLGND